MTPKYQERARVVKQEPLAAGIFSLWLEAPRVAGAARPGQFVNVYSADSGHLLPRPISLCQIADGRIRLVYRVAGSGTREFSGLQAGDCVDILGPLGNGYPVETEQRHAFLIGGGIGIPPLVALAQALPGKKTAVLGFRDERFLTEELTGAGADLVIATEDGSYGTKGNVLDAIAAHGLSPKLIYACGPTPMLRALSQYAAEHQAECYLSLEQRMACGVGACLACVCRSAQVDEHSQVKNKRVCVEGPVFRAQDVVLLFTR